MERERLRRETKLMKKSLVLKKPLEVYLLIECFKSQINVFCNFKNVKTAIRFPTVTKSKQKK